MKRLAAQAFRLALQKGLLHCLAYFFSPNFPVCSTLARGPGAKEKSDTGALYPIDFIATPNHFVLNLLLFLRF